MNIITIFEKVESFYNEAASLIAKGILRKPDAVVGLSTGRTTKLIHRRLSEIISSLALDTNRMTFFGVDEVVGVPKAYSGACYTMLRTELLDSLGVPDDRFLMFPTSRDAYPEACRRFTEAIGRLGGIDILMLGLGENGHLGFNQPGTPFGSTAWLSKMDPELDARIHRETGIPSDQQLGGATLGLKDIMRARKIILVANGKRKADIVKRMLHGPVTPDVPASILQLHPNCEYLLDAEAAKEL